MSTSEPVRRRSPDPPTRSSGRPDANDVWLSADEAADRLGIAKATLYAYVSRGRITRDVDASGRRSRYPAREIARLAGGRSHPPRPGTVELRIGTAVTRLEEDSLAYRGASVSTLIGSTTYEEVAALLWQRPVLSWKPSTAARQAAGHVWQDGYRERNLPPGAVATLLARSVLAVGGTDEYRGDLRPDAVVVSAAELIGALSSSLPGVGDADRTVAARLFRHNGAPRPKATLRAGRASTPADAARRKQKQLSQIDLIDATLVSLADHELATSTFAVRLAASTCADPYAAISAGLSVLSGPLHGSASADAFSMLEHAHESGRPARALGERLASSTIVPGFGHPVYRGADPRCVALLRVLERSEVDRARLATVHAVVGEAAVRVPKAPNVDFAVAAVAFCCGLVSSAGEMIFAFARLLGWVAHYLEELDEAALRFRVRAVYRGL